MVTANPSAVQPNQNSLPEFYHILGVPTSASLDEIKSAYKCLPCPCMSSYFDLIPDTTLMLTTAL